MKEGSKCVQNSLDAQQHGNIVYTTMTLVVEYQLWVHKISLIFGLKVTRFKGKFDGFFFEMEEC